MIPTLEQIENVRQVLVGAQQFGSAPGLATRSLPTGGAFIQSQPQRIGRGAPVHLWINGTHWRWVWRHWEISFFRHYTDPYSDYQPPGIGGASLLPVDYTFLPEPGCLAWRINATLPQGTAEDTYGFCWFRTVAGPDIHCSKPAQYGQPYCYRYAYYYEPLDLEPAPAYRLKPYRLEISWEGYTSNNTIGNMTLAWVDLGLGYFKVLERAFNGFVGYGTKAVPSEDDHKPPAGAYYSSPQRVTVYPGSLCGLWLSTYRQHNNPGATNIVITVKELGPDTFQRGVPS